MFSGIFSTSAPVDPTAQNFEPVSARYSASEVNGALTPKDTEWACETNGFITETQTFYTITEDGSSVMCQVIHSAVGVWYPTIQFTFKYYDSKSGATSWKSVNVSNFKTPGAGKDKRSCKADEFSITHKGSNEKFAEAYSITANLDKDVQVFMDVGRPASVPGFKIGNGERGGYSYFGPDTKNPEGSVIHRFWPRFEASGHIVLNGQMKTLTGHGMFVHAIQGMRPNLVASRWNFAHFQSEQQGGVSAIQMEFTTLDTHGPKGAGSGPVKVNIGSLVVDNQLVLVTADSSWPGQESSMAASGLVSKATHLKTEADVDTGYQKPGELLFEWAGPSVGSDTSSKYSAKLLVDVGNVVQPKGLIEKVDVLAEIPYVLKMAVNYVAGTKPFIYQWFNPVKLSYLKNGEETEVEGYFYNEATFIS